MLEMSYATGGKNKRLKVSRAREVGEQHFIGGSFFSAYSETAGLWTHEAIKEVTTYEFTYHSIRTDALGRPQILYVHAMHLTSRCENFTDLLITIMSSHSRRYFRDEKALKLNKNHIIVALSLVLARKRAAFPLAINDWRA